MHRLHVSVWAFKKNWNVLCVVCALDHTVVDNRGNTTFDLGDESNSIVVTVDTGERMRLPERLWREVVEVAKRSWEALPQLVTWNDHSQHLVGHSGDLGLLNTKVRESHDSNKTVKTSDGRHGVGEHVISKVSRVDPGANEEEDNQ